MKIEKKVLLRYLLLAIIAILVFTSFKILQPYLIILISAFILAYLIKPVYSRLNKKLGKNNSAFLSIIILFILLIIPFSIIIGGITNQAYKLINKENLNKITQIISEIPFIENIDVANLTERVTSELISTTTSVLSYLPSLIISLIVLIFALYYILIDWDKLSKELKKYLPFKNKEKVANDIASVTNGLIYGMFLTAIIEFVLAMAGFYISGVELYLLLPVLIFFFAFIPSLGPTIVWVPMAIFYVFTQNWFTLAGVVITGLILSIYVDAVLRTKILGRKAKIHPLIMLVGILGGISIFGLFGFLIGPLVLIYTIELIKTIVE